MKAKTVIGMALWDRVLGSRLEAASAIIAALDAAGFVIVPKAKAPAAIRALTDTKEG